MARTPQQREIEQLERTFWQSMVDGRPELATQMLAEPAVMVSSHGPLKFDHAAYEKMARDDRQRLVDYAISGMDVVFPRDDVAVANYRVKQTLEADGCYVENEVFDTSTWVRVGDRWLCVMHTESEAAPRH
jgi:hypothetical protein